MARWVLSVLVLGVTIGCKSEGEVGDKVENLGRATGPVASASPAPDRGPMPPAGAETPQTVISGKVVETIDASRYTYIKIQVEAGAEVWAAVPQIALTSGESVAVIQSLVMKDFESKTLDRVFPTVVFGVLNRQSEAGAAAGMGR